MRSILRREVARGKTGDVQRRPDPRCRPLESRWALRFLGDDSRGVGYLLNERVADLSFTGLERALASPTRNTAWRRDCLLERHSETQR